MNVMIYFSFILVFIVDLSVWVYGILGGKNVNICDAPFQVSYADKCGAVLIHSQWALTTAHCGPEGTYIRIGSRRRLKGPKAQIHTHIIHSSYQKHHEFDYDVQLLRLFKSLHLSKLVNTIEICDRDCGSDIQVFGWGYSKEKGDYNDILQEIKINLVPVEECQKVKNPWYNHTLTSRMFCAGEHGKDACQGDSGGAAVSLGKLVGLSSFGYGCGRDLPGVYTNIRHNNIRPWIKRITGV